MASEGELLVCTICTNRKKERLPKALGCLHSFCLECLTGWHDARVADGRDSRTTLQCPICRKTSTVPPGGVENLPTDFKVHEIEEVMQAVNISIKCQRNVHEGQHPDATALCKTCDRRFCSGCTEHHLRQKHFERHVIVRTVCTQHVNELTYLCKRCLVGLCVDCSLGPEHEGHEVEQLTPGLDTMKSSIAETKAKLEQLLMRSERFMKQEKGTVEGLKVSREKMLREVRDVMVSQIDAIFAQLLVEHEETHMSSVTGLFQEQAELCQQAHDIIRRANQILPADVKRSLEMLPDVFPNIVKRFREMSEVFKAVPRPSLISGDACCCSVKHTDYAIKAVEQVSLQPNIDSGLYKRGNVTKPLLHREWDVKQPNGVTSPYQLAALPDCSAVFVDTRLGVLVKCKSEGSVVTGFAAVEDGEQVAAVAAYRGCIFYINTDGTVLTMLDSQTNKKQEVYKINPPVAQPRGLVVTQTSYVVINETQVIQCSRADGKQKRIGKGGDFTFVDSGFIEGANKILVSDARAKRVMVYDESGQLCRTIGCPGVEDGQFQSPAGIAVTANSTILVADTESHRVSQFSPSGHFLGHLLTYDDALRYPAGVGFCYPYLWVTQLPFENKLVKLYCLSKPKPEEPQHQILQGSDFAAYMPDDLTDSQLQNLLSQGAF